MCEYEKSTWDKTQPEALSPMDTIVKRKKQCQLNLPKKKKRSRTHIFIMTCAEIAEKER